MCGRFEFSLKDDKKGKQIKERAEKLNLVYKEGEIFPTDQVLCIIPVENKIDLSVMKWGINNKSLQINARKESIDDKPSYNEIKNNRCAVICNGFYEWNRQKDKFYISGDDEYMYKMALKLDPKLESAESRKWYEKTSYYEPYYYDYYDWW